MVNVGRYTSPMDPIMGHWFSRPTLVGKHVVFWQKTAGGETHRTAGLSSTRTDPRASDLARAGDVGRDED